MSISELINNAPDPFFKARARHEYGVVRAWTSRQVAIDNATILDFGCGEGVAAASFALQHPTANVFGCDIVAMNEPRLARQLDENLGVGIPKNLTLLMTPPGALPESIAGLDLVFAWSVFEHISEDAALELLRLIRSRMKPEGVFFLQINPLYFSPRGAHLYRLFKEPWVHLLKDLQTLQDSYSKASPTSDREWIQFMELNRLTADDITGLCEAAGFKVAKQERLHSNLTPPARLLQTYTEDVLKTEEVRLLLLP